MKITEAYEKYKIMPTLQMHHFRVAATANQICKSIKIKIDSDSIIKAALLHDLGNIIKSDLDKNYFNSSNEEIEYWKKEKEIFIEKYGNKTTEAMLTISKELGVSNFVLDLLEHNDFKYVCDISKSDSFERKILKYSDLRAGLHGIISLSERFEDIKRRYGDLLKDDRQDCAEEVEKQIFEYASIKPEDINDESVKNIIEELKNFEI